MPAYSTKDDYLEISPKFEIFAPSIDIFQSYLGRFKGLSHKFMLNVVPVAEKR